MPEFSQIAAQIAFGPIQIMMVEEKERLWAAAVYARGGWMVLPLQVVVLGSKEVQCTSTR